MKYRIHILTLILTFCIKNIEMKAQGSEPLLGQIVYVAFDFAPVGWEECNGKSLSISENSALFALLGTTYGGDGVNTFNLPNLQGRVLVHNTPEFPLGSMGGTESETLTLQQMPAHNHQIQASNVVGDSTSPQNAIPADSQLLDKKYSKSTSNLVTMHNLSVGTVGGYQAHNNMQPYITFKCIIATEGIFPSQN